MRRRLSKEQINAKLQAATGIAPYYMTIPNDYAVPPYIVWLFSDTEFTGDNLASTVAKDDIMIYLCTTDYDETNEMAIVNAFDGTNISISRVYSNDEHLHMAMITVTLYGKI